jgi:putative transposase
MLVRKKSGFSHGVFVYAAGMRLAPQETRTYLVTAVTAQRRRLFQVTATAKLLEQTILDYHSQEKFFLHAFVIMPDHFHALITPAPDISLEKAMQFIKGGFSFRLKSKLDVWMRSFNESQILTKEKFVSCVRYIEENPVRQRLVSTPGEYSFSSSSCEQLDPMPLHLESENCERQVRA